MFPKSTEFNKRIPKQKFYDNIAIAPNIKRCFVEQVKLIYWKNKISPSTINIVAGNNVSEIQVFEIKLNSPELDEAVLVQIDKAIPYHILFLLEYNGKYKACIAYKELIDNKAYKLNSYYYTPYLNMADLALSIQGLNMDKVYENFVIQIAGDNLAVYANENLKLSVQREEKRKSLIKQILALKAKLRNEKQLNRQMDINRELKKLMADMEGLDV